jgi:hypothetical protein
MMFRFAIIGGSYTSHPAILNIGNSKSDNFTVSVTYNDGIGDLTSEQEFSTIRIEQRTSRQIRNLKSP